MKKKKSKKKKSKKKISNEERIRRTIQAQRAVQGYAVIGKVIFL